MFKIDLPDMVIGLDKIVKDDEEKEQEKNLLIDDDTPETFETDEGSGISESEDDVDDTPAADE